MISYAIIGAGWRSEFYIRLALLCPEEFFVSGIYIRNKEKRELFKSKYNIAVFDNSDDLLKTKFDFLVTCVNKDNNFDVAQDLAAKGYYVLSETPFTKATSFPNIQVAEQFHFMPRFCAYKSIIDSRLLGKITQVDLSCCHDYHAISLIRFLLNTGDEIPKVTSIKLNDTVRQYNSRSGHIKNPQIKESLQILSVLKFENKTAIYNFNKEQYFSDIRQSQIIIRGTDGEIFNDDCTYYKDKNIYSFKIVRNEQGKNENLDGLSLVNITGNGKLLYTNPFKDFRLSDEDIAIATVLTRMDKFVKTGRSFYTTEEALLDYEISKKFTNAL